MDLNFKESFLSRRHEYILRRRESLNEMTFKIFSIFQLALASLSAAQFAVLKDVESSEISKDVALFASSAVLGFFMIAVMGYISLSFGGMLAWINYRREESEIEVAVGMESRPPPGVSDLVKWYEFYLIILVIVVAACVIVWYFAWLFPHLCSIVPGRK